MHKTARRRWSFTLLAWLVLVLALAGTATADEQGFEAPLDPAGYAYEVNRGADGELWISDYDAGTVWSVDPLGGTYKVYDVQGAPSDARQEAGWLWWVDGEANLIGRASPVTGASTRWAVPGATGFYGTAVDAEARLWASSVDLSFLYRLDPAAATLCTFTLPDQGIASYLVRSGDFLWLGDFGNSRILRLTISNNSLTSWQLPPNSTPFGMALDAQGKLWFADDGQNAISRLDPVDGKLTSFALPGNEPPVTVVVEGDRIWYSILGAARIGRINPASASQSQTTIPIASTTLSPACAPISPSSTGQVAITAGQLAWTQRTYATSTAATGIVSVQLPPGAAGWGLTFHAGQLWVVDQGRQQLVRMSSSGAQEIYLPMLFR